MSVENHPSVSSGTSAGNGGKTVDSAAMNALQAAFAKAVQRSFAGLESNKDGLLGSDKESLRSTDSEQTEQRLGSERNNPRETGSDAALRKSLDRTEIRQEGLDGEYRDQTQNRDEARQTHLEKHETPIRDKNLLLSNVSIGLSESFSITEISSPPGTVSAPVLLNATNITSPLPAQSVQNIHAGQGGTTQSQAFPVTPGMVAQPGMNVQHMTPQASTIPTAGQTNTMAVMTVFSAGGRFENGKGSLKEKEETETKKKDRRTHADFTFGVFAPETPLETAPRSPRSGSDHAAQQETASEVKILPTRIFRDEKNDDPAQERRTETEDAAIDKTIREILKNLSPQEARPDPELVSLTPQPPRPATDETPTEERRQRIMLVKRIAAACRSAAQQGGNFRIKLHLGERLGSLSLRLKFRDDHVSVRFQATTQHAGRLLSESTEELREELARNDLTLDELDIRVLTTED